MPEPWWNRRSSTRSIPGRSPTVTATGSAISTGSARHLDHLAWLGVDALWLSPFFRSPMADFGYDVSDYCDVDPGVRRPRRLRRALAEAHDRGIRVVLDWVPNHTSRPAPVVRRVASSRDDPKRDWYIWRDPAPDGGAAQQLDRGLRRGRRPGPSTTPPASTTSTCFLPEQPDLNWANPEVEAAMHDVLRFWLDRGVDGFRMDVIHLHRQGPGPARRPARAGRRSPRAASTTDPRPTGCCGASARCSTPTPATA